MKGFAIALPHQNDLDLTIMLACGDRSRPDAAHLQVRSDIDPFDIFVTLEPHWCFMSRTEAGGPRSEILRLVC